MAPSFESETAGAAVAELDVAGNPIAIAAIILTLATAAPKTASATAAAAKECTGCRCQYCLG